MKLIADFIGQMNQTDIATMERENQIRATIGGQDVVLTGEDVEILSEDIPGWQVANEGALTVAIDITVTDELRKEGIAREFINRIQNLRKDSGFEVTDKILVQIMDHPEISAAIDIHQNYIAAQTLAKSIELVANLEQNTAKLVELDDSITTYIRIVKV